MVYQQQTTGVSGGRVIASFDSYAEAQRALDTLADRQFRVEHASIIGRDVRLVDRVMGRASAGKAALAGLATGAWIGLMVGLVFAIVSPWAFGAISVGVLLGGALGARCGLVAHALLGGNRVIESLRTIEAASYELGTGPRPSVHRSSANPAVLAEAIAREGILSDRTGHYAFTLDRHEVEFTYTGPQTLPAAVTIPPLDRRLP
jgi:hypothetical protein